MSEQTSFVQALLNPDLACPDGLKTWNGSDPAVRFAVYRNNVAVSLIDALADTFPVVQELVGEEFFRAMARVFAQANPPRSRLMAYYGDAFADFLESFAPVATLPYLADVARLEMCRVQAYHAADAPPADHKALQSILDEPQQLLSLVLSLHPSVHLVESRYAVFSLWAAHQGALDISEVDPQLAQAALVFRNGLDVDTMEVSAGTGRFLRQLLAGQTLAAAAGAASATVVEFDLSSVLALLLGHQLITHFNVGDHSHEQIH